MSDMLVKLYEIEDGGGCFAGQRELGIVIRKPIGTEKQFVVNWVGEKFGRAWASETDTALGNRPFSCFIAVRDGTMIGFACYDATALGFFGPTGVDETHRGRGTGYALLLACLLDMKSKGYGYAIIGDAGPAYFYANKVGAVEIPHSTPGVYGGMLGRDREED